MATPTPAPVHIETLRKPTDYPPAQLIVACAIQQALERGKLVLCEPPWWS